MSAKIKMKERGEPERRKNRQRKSKQRKEIGKLQPLCVKIRYKRRPKDIMEIAVHNKM